MGQDCSKILTNADGGPADRRARLMTLTPKGGDCLRAPIPSGDGLGLRRQVQRLSRLRDLEITRLASRRKDGYSLTKIGFAPPGSRSQSLPSNVSPIQKSLWWDSAITEADRGKDFELTTARLNQVNVLVRGFIMKPSRKNSPIPSLATTSKSIT
jgi:hypothetical protein